MTNGDDDDAGEYDGPNVGDGRGAEGPTEFAVSRCGTSSRRATSPPHSQRRRRSRSRRSRARVECSSSPHSERGSDVPLVLVPRAAAGEGRAAGRPRPNGRTCDPDKGYEELGEETLNEP